MMQPDEGDPVRRQSVPSASSMAASLVLKYPHFGILRVRRFHPGCFIDDRAAPAFQAASLWGAPTDDRRRRMPPGRPCGKGDWQRMNLTISRLTRSRTRGSCWVAGPDPGGLVSPGRPGLFRVVDVGRLPPAREESANTVNSLWACQARSLTAPRSSPAETCRSARWHSARRNTSARLGKSLPLHRTSVAGWPNRSPTVGCSGDELLPKIAIDRLGDWWY